MTNNSDVVWMDGPYIRSFWANKLRFYRPSTQKIYEKWISGWISFLCGRWSIPPQEINYLRCTEIEFNGHTFYSPISRQLVLDFLETIEAPSNRRFAQTALHVYFAWLLEREKLDFNPVPPVDYKSNARPHKSGLSVNEITQLVREIRREPIWIRTALSVQLAAGLRVSELIALRVSDIEEVDADKWVIHVRREARKSRRENCLPLPEIKDIIYEYLTWRAELQSSSDTLFLTQDGNKWNAPSINEHIHRLGRTAGCSRQVTSHDLRRAYATLNNHVLGDMDLMGQLLRHEQVEITYGYVAVPSISDLRRALSSVHSYNLANDLAREVLERRERR